MYVKFCACQCLTGGRADSTYLQEVLPVAEFFAVNMCKYFSSIN